MDHNKIDDLKDRLTQAIDDLVQAAFLDGKDTGRQEMRDQLRSLLGDAAPAPSPPKKKPQPVLSPEKIEEAVLNAVLDFADLTPDGVGPPGLVTYFTDRALVIDAHQVRVALKNLQLSGQIKRIENRYVPAEPEAAAPAEDQAAQ